jgi:REP element-mobilizing transposase RayT
MSRAKRRELLPANEINTAHCIQRAVRRAFLSGVDRETGKDFSYRRNWIRMRLETLASVFGIDVLSYAVMSNHLHVIVRNRPDVVEVWTDEEVAARWLRVFPGKRLDEFLAEPTENDVKTLAANAERIAEIRENLSDISWFMRALSEPIARRANKEDKCTGRFWEGRFKAQKLADEAAILACSMYVDMNPIRASMAETPEQAVHTSAYDRLSAERGEHVPSAALDLTPITVEEASEQRRRKSVAELMDEVNKKRKNPTGKRVLRDSWLAPMLIRGDELSSDPKLNREGLRASDRGFLNVNWGEYIELLRWTAQQKLSETAAAVPAALGQTLATLGIEASMWGDLVWNFKRYFGRASCAGRPETMAAEAERKGKRCYHGQKLARECFAAA